MFCMVARRGVYSGGGLMRWWLPMVESIEMLSGGGFADGVCSGGGLLRW